MPLTRSGSEQRRTEVSALLRDAHGRLGRRAARRRKNARSKSQDAGGFQRLRGVALVGTSSLTRSI